MRFKRILSTALLVVMIFTTVAAALPFTASAAHSQTAASASGIVPDGYKEANLKKAQLEEFIDNEYINYNFETAAEMLNYELQKGYLYYSNFAVNESLTYTLFVNKYTGFVYYVNNLTGQILTSNPINPASASSKLDKQVLMSQILVKYTEAENSTVGDTLNSTKESALRSQISVSNIAGGIRVNYTIGDTAARFLLPGSLTAEQFEETILGPMLDKYQSLLELYCSEKYPDTNFSFFDNEDFEPYIYGCIDHKTLRDKYLEKFTKDIYTKALRPNSDEYKQLNTLRADIIKIMAAYTLKNPLDEDVRDKELSSMYEDYPITEEGIAIYVYTQSIQPATKRSYANIIKANCPEYTFALMFEQEEECGYVDESVQKPVFRCSLEYTFNSDGSISARLPASSISFDETMYVLDKITPLPYFGGADMSNGGYAFYPDGSGTIIDFNDFHNESKTVNINILAPVYGLDYAYSQIDTIKGIAFREQVTMPVYGMAIESAANADTKLKYGVDTVTNGFFAIIEEGSALAYLSAESGGASHPFIGLHAYYTPYPSDIYDLSETLSVGSLGIYKMVSESKYAGSYTTRYVMLTDEEVGNKTYGEKSFYTSDYVGMATYYRDFLKTNGVLTALENLSDDMPLYIEVLGAMDITAKFLSFPVTKTIPLTTFEDIAEIYDNLSKCEEFIVAKIDEYKKLAAEEEDDVQKYQYNKQVDRYTELVGKIQNIKNINFKLSGFANGGLDATYPAKLKWVKACGGSSDFEDLVEQAKAISASGEYNFSLFPEFDFMYINNTKMFDGISEKNSAAVMVDNRYASKQMYNSVLQEFEKAFSIVVSPDALEGLYDDFNDKYSSYENPNISVSTMGSNLNSNFDKDDPVNREDAMVMLKEVLDTMANTSGYNVMTDTGNIFSVEYAKHILNAPIDSSHHRYASYTVPFTAIVLHSYVNYTGDPINYSGSPEYDRLRAIESGAALYYIVCYQNSSYLKDDEDLSKYYGVDYHNWFDSIVENYKILNDLIGGLQDYEIVDHKILKAERAIEKIEKDQKYSSLYKELLTFLENQLIDSIDDALLALQGDPDNYDKRLKLNVDMDALMLRFSGILNLSIEEMNAPSSVGSISFADMVLTLVSKYTDEYCGAADAANNVDVNFVYSMEDMLTALLEPQIFNAIAAKLPNTDFAAEAAEIEALIDKEFDESDATAIAKAKALIPELVALLKSAHTSSPEVIDRIAIRTAFAGAFGLAESDKDFKDTKLSQKLDSIIASYDNILLDLNLDEMLSRFAKLLEISVSELKSSDFGKSVCEYVGRFTTAFDGSYDENGNLNAKVVRVKYSFVYTTDIYITDSSALDSDYVYTDYTIDNGNVTMVTYKKGDSVVRFILNYNNYAVNVRLSATETYMLPKYGCHKISN